MTRPGRPGLLFHSVLWGVALLILSGCAARRYVPGRPLQNPALQARLEAQLASAYPPQFELTQRIGLKVGGRGYDFLGFLAWRADDTLHAVGAGEMGGKIFDIEARGQEISIHKSPPGMPLKPLREGVIQDIRHLYGPPPPGSAHLVQREHGTLGLVISSDEDTRLREYIFTTEARLVRTWEVEQGRVVREAAYSDFRSLPGWAQPIPVRIVLKNARWHYSLAIEAIKIHPLVRGSDTPGGRP